VPAKRPAPRARLVSHALLAKRLMPTPKCPTLMVKKPKASAAASVGAATGAAGAPARPVTRLQPLLRKLPLPLAQSSQAYLLRKPGQMRFGRAFLALQVAINAFSKGWLALL
jgi:hypothetical protein